VKVKRILVTGSSGLIGSEAVEYFDPRLLEGRKHSCGCFRYTK